MKGHKSTSVVASRFGRIQKATVRQAKGGSRASNREGEGQGTTAEQREMRASKARSAGADRKWR